MGRQRLMEKSALINNALHSIIKQFTIKINKTLVTEQSHTQAYNAYIKTLLSFTEQARKSYLTKALYYKDTTGHTKEVDNTTDHNEGLQKRAAFTNNGTEVVLVGVPRCDLFNNDKILLNELEIKFNVDLNSDSLFLLVVTLQTSNSLKYPQCSHRACRRQYQTRTFKEHARSEGEPSPTSYLYVNMTPTYASIIPAGVLNHTDTYLFNGLLPQCIIFGIVLNDAFNGSLTRNPFKVNLFGLSAIRLTVNGEETLQTWATKKF